LVSIILSGTLIFSPGSFVGRPAIGSLLSIGRSKNMVNYRNKFVNRA
jgi:hypothetical protein